MFLLCLSNTFSQDSNPGLLILVDQSSCLQSVTEPLNLFPSDRPREPLLMLQRWRPFRRLPGPPRSHQRRHGAERLRHDSRPRRRRRRANQGESSCVIGLHTDDPGECSTKTSMNLLSDLLLELSKNSVRAWIYWVSCLSSRCSLSTARCARRRWAASWRASPSSNTRAKLATRVSSSRTTTSSTTTPGLKQFPFLKSSSRTGPTGWFCFSLQSIFKFFFEKCSANN